MKLLILTQYFPPETGAPQNRLYELAIRLKEKGCDVVVLTAMPNYPKNEIYSEYKKKLYKYEEMDGLKIHRAYIFVKKSKSIFFRLLNYFSFVITSFCVGLFKIGKIDIILCESPPLFLGISAYGLKKIKKTSLIFNVSDLWPETAEKLGLISNKFLLNSSTKLEEFLYRKSDLISGQTQGICNNILARFSQKKVHCFPNGVDIKSYTSLVFKTNSNYEWRLKNNLSIDDFVILYAGIIGHAQGLEVIINAAKQLSINAKIKFVIVGDGPEKEKLQLMQHKLGINNVLFLGSFSKRKIPEILNSIDTSIIPLKKLDLFKGAIPSKIFEVLAMKKPILLGVEGEAKELFIDKGKSGIAFIPEDDNDLSEKILLLYNNLELRIQLGNNGFKYVEQNFDRDKIVDEFWQFISRNLNPTTKQN